MCKITSKIVAGNLNPHFRRLAIFHIKKWEIGKISTKFVSLLICEFFEVGPRLLTCR